MVFVENLSKLFERINPNKPAGCDKVKNRFTHTKWERTISPDRFAAIIILNTHSASRYAF